MSDSNIGARKMKNIRNHLFIIYGVINSVLKGESECIDIQIYDLVKAFDVLWLADTMNDCGTPYLSMHVMTSWAWSTKLVKQTWWQ